jgi:hypothetical protein
VFFWTDHFDADNGHSTLCHFFYAGFLLINAHLFTDTFIWPKSRPFIELILACNRSRENTASMPCTRAKGAIHEARFFLIAAFCRLAKSLNHSEQMGWVVGVSTRTASRSPEISVDEIDGQGRSFSPGGKSLVMAGMLGARNTSQLRDVF